MNVNFLNPFVDAAVEVLQAEVDVAATKGLLDLQKSALTTDDITVLIHLVGQVHGVVLYGLPFSTGLKMVSHIMDQEFTEFGSLAQSGVAELGNVITAGRPSNSPRRATRATSRPGAHHRQRCADFHTRFPSHRRPTHHRNGEHDHPPRLREGTSGIQSHPTISSG